MTDYHKHPIVKHLFWYSFITTTGLGMGAMTYQWNYMMVFDIMYMLANSMSFMAVLSYYSTFPNDSSLLLSFIAATSGMLYSVGFLRIIRCGMDLYNKNVYLGWLSLTSFLIPYMLYRSC
jgi:hypothetical protein